MKVLSTLQPSVKGEGKRFLVKSQSTPDNDKTSSSGNSREGNYGMQVQLLNAKWYLPHKAVKLLSSQA